MITAKQQKALLKLKKEVARINKKQRKQPFFTELELMHLRMCVETQIDSAIGEKAEVLNNIIHKMDSKGIRDKANKLKIYLTY